MLDTPPALALFWDESHLWGLLLLRALQALDAPVTVLRADQIRTGALDALAPDILLVPGGWARLKSLALGETGRNAVRSFVAGGGTYIGFCGGAGLALTSEARTPFLDLCSWSRKPANQRLPNFSGHLRCKIRNNGLEETAELPVWWPSQFAPDPAAPLDTIASYEGPGRDFWSADLDWSGVAPGEVRQWEELYGINLDPDRLRGEPCIVRGRHGQGAVILSYAHLETPASPQANALLAKLLGLDRSRPVPAWDLGQDAPVWDDPVLGRMQADLAELIRFGQGHFLLFWREPWLLGWRRGVPGSPITFLHAMIWQARHNAPTNRTRAFWINQGPRCQLQCADFCAQARSYLLQERRILATSPSSPEASASPDLQGRKLELFGKFPGYGGIYGNILRTLDEVLWLQFSAPDAWPDRP